MENALKPIEAKAISRYIRMSPKKVERVLNQVRGKSYKEALMLLEFMPYRSCGPVWQVIYSAAANAQNNYGLSKEDLYICEAKADKGPILRRFRPRAQGRGYAIRKPTCHISIKLQSIN
uniref:Large ribosomal subunit protein uL22c n=1 Tax=Rhizochromulina marina TaxID=1034831 RepID=A0A514CPV6_9STRA|nr:ribosomal protein L22 [Rhizochromulina marina]QDH81836.1 ribosomal protein L22 [Rhizochromulina marina]